MLISPLRSRKAESIFSRVGTPLSRAEAMTSSSWRRIWLRVSVRQCPSSSRTERRAVDEASEAIGAGAQPGDGEMPKGNGDDLQQSVGERGLVADHGGERKSAHEEDEDELEGGHLFARTATYDPDDKDEENVTAEGTYDWSHCTEPLGEEVSSACDVSMG